MTLEIFHNGRSKLPKDVYRTINPNEKEIIAGLEILNTNIYPVYVRIK